MADGITPRLGIPYQIKRSNRRTVTIIVRENGDAEVRVPLRYPALQVEQLVREKEDWIDEKRRKALRSRQRLRDLTLPVEEYEKAKRVARSVIPKRVAYFAARMHTAYGDVKIKDQKTRWGSCSAKGNLNFNWRLIMAPDAVLDYVVVHELCHRHHMNHSAAFWQYLEQIMPDYRKARKWLKENGTYLSNIAAAAPDGRGSDERTANEK